jgi:hypothetical protein
MDKFGSGSCPVAGTVEPTNSSTRALVCQLIFKLKTVRMNKNHLISYNKSLVMAELCSNTYDYSSPDFSFECLLEKNIPLLVHLWSTVFSPYQVIKFILKIHYFVNSISGSQ